MKKLLYISVLFLFGMTSCIQDYLDDGGTHSAESTLSKANGLPASQTS